MQALSITELIDDIARGEQAEYFPFWGHQPRKDDTLGASCLSQWWPAEFTVEGSTFRTAEHFMMWRKAMLFEDLATAEKVLAAEHPKEAKSLGRQISGFDEKIWETNRYQVVVSGNIAKFGQHEDLRRFLLHTGDQVLVEAIPVDRIWGIGLAIGDPRVEDPAQ
ncbi:NADAR family protein [Nocardia sp. 004]|uniref:NADAR family protein n=1 Tax=Nocardia sp. 004 TaxID=3385978 RepID=UPI0039A2DC75